eukprot:GHVT01104673.1.p1 GENE.GHVT01104673.1~~GHVT01104673.1.p1  ORF type:complete len:362 (+),score=18.03 GHVT01104673.1:250-1335(+)
MVFSTGKTKLDIQSLELKDANSDVPNFLATDNSFSLQSDYTHECHLSANAYRNCGKLIVCFTNATEFAAVKAIGHTARDWEKITTVVNIFNEPPFVPELALRHNEVLVDTRDVCGFDNRYAIVTTKALLPYNDAEKNLYKTEFPSANCGCELDEQKGAAFHPVGFPDAVEVIYASIIVNNEPPTMQGYKFRNHISELLSTNSNNVKFRGAYDDSHFRTGGVILKGMRVGDLGFMHERHEKNLCLISTAISVPLAALVGPTNLERIMEDIKQAEASKKADLPNKSALLQEITETSKMQTMYGAVKVLTVDKDGVLTINKSHDLYFGDSLVALHTSHESIKVIAAKSLHLLPPQKLSTRTRLF